MVLPLVLAEEIDSSTWLALGLVLTLVGLVLAAAVWRRSGAGRGLRVAGWSLVPLAAALTGLLRLVWDILVSVLDWALGLVFSPLVWLGLCVAAVALALHVAGTLLVRRRRPADVGRAEVGAAATPTGAPPLTSSAEVAPDSRRRRRRAGKPEVVEDQDDIEAILRRHGIE